MEMEDRRFRISIRAIILIVVNCAVTLAILLWLLVYVPGALSKGWGYAVIVLSTFAAMGIFVWSTLKQIQLAGKSKTELR